MKNYLFPFLLFLGGLAAVVITNIIQGFVLSLLWGWFVVPLGIMSIGFFHAIGLILITRLLVISVNLYEKKKEAKPTDSLYIVGLTPLVILGLGYIVTLLM